MTSKISIMLYGLECWAQEILCKKIYNGIYGLSCCEYVKECLIDVIVKQVESTRGIGMS